MNPGTADTRQSFFELFRLAELDDTLRLFDAHARKHARVLEIGAGTGWQARALSDKGYEVSAIDLPSDVEFSNHARARVYPVVDYDGVAIPFADATFDIVYSSNVLEHVRDLDGLDDEIHRVLKPGGRAIHLVPSTVWRASSILSHYPAQAVDAVRFLRKRLSPPRKEQRADCTVEAAVAAPPSGDSLFRKMVGRLAPRTHGAVGTPISELSRFSRQSWIEFFLAHDWAIAHCADNGIWATGDHLAGHALSLGARRRIAGVVGGIAHVFVLISTRAPPEIAETPKN